MLYISFSHFLYFIENDEIRELYFIFIFLLLDLCLRRLLVFLFFYTCYNYLYHENISIKNLKIRKKKLLGIIGGKLYQKIINFCKKIKSIKYN